MTITFHQPAAPAARATRRGAPTSLMQRIEKAPLLERLSGAPRAPKSQPMYVAIAIRTVRRALTVLQAEWSWADQDQGLSARARG